MNLFIWGLSGKMGQMLLELSKSSSDFKLVDQLEDAQIVVDFSLPEGTHTLLQKLQPGQILVSGTTSLSKDTIKMLEDRAKKETVFHSSNFSIGVALFNKILRDYSKLFKHFNYHPSLVDIHHAQKPDSPSGTALALKTSMEPFFSNTLITSKREGVEVGYHAAQFESDNEVLMFSHQAKDRKLFAIGALNVCRWIFSNHNSFKNQNRVLLMSNYLNHLTETL